MSFPWFLLQPSHKEEHCHHFWHKLWKNISSYLTTVLAVFLSLIGQLKGYIVNSQLSSHSEACRNEDNYMLASKWFLELGEGNYHGELGTEKRNLHASVFIRFLDVVDVSERSSFWLNILNDREDWEIKERLRYW